MIEVVGSEDFWACAAPEVLMRMTGLAHRALKASGAMISSFTPDHQLIRCASGLQPKTTTVPIAEALCGRVIASDQPVALSSWQADGPSLFEAPILSYLGVPVRLSSGDAIGVLCVVDKHQHDWTDDERDLMTQLAVCLTNQIELKLEMLRHERIDAALKATQARLLAAADHIPGLVFERRKIGPARSCYTFFGSLKTQLPAVREMMKSGDAGSLGFIHRDDRESVRTALLRCTLEETDLDLTFRVKELDGSLRWLRSQSIVRREADGAVLWDGLCFDITDLVAAQEQAEAARTEKEATFVNVNHELRTPLQAIIGFTEFLRTERRPEHVAAHARNIQSAAKAVLSVVNRTLNNAGNDADILPLFPDAVDIRAFSETCLSLVGPLAAEKRLASRVVVDDDLPATVVIDEQKVQQALLNLLNNAIKFTDRGGVTLTVKRAASGLRFGVVDTGIGILPEQRNRLFQRFSRIDGTPGATEGTGLGLAITKDLIEELNGRIGVIANRDGGSTFWFEIPLQPGPPAEQTVEVEPTSLAHANDTISEARRARILVADDLDLNRKLIADMLQIEDHVVDCVADGAAAIKAASEQTYDLILMDMIMPGVDGLAATREIRKLPSPAGRVPIIALTANSFREQLDSCLEAGMDATLTKPMSLEALAAAVSSWTRDRDKAA